MARYKIEIETYAHATEKLDSITRSLIDLLGEDAPLVIEVTWGHYGNPIFRIYSVIEDEEKIMLILTRICKSVINMDYLRKTLPNRMDGRNLYFRLNKQGLVMGRYIIDDGDDVVKIRLRIEKGDIMEIIKRACGD